MATNPSKNVETYFQSPQKAGWNAYAERTTNRPFVPECSTTVKVASGQVLKARSFVELSATQVAEDYPVVTAARNITEVAKVVFATNLADTKTLVVAGLTITATGGAVTPAQVVEILTTLTSVGFGILTGTLSGWSIAANDTTSVVFYSTAIDASVSDLTVTVASGGNMTGTITKVDGVASTYRRLPYGILAYDVDATSADTVASVYTEAKGYASEVVWSVNTTTDTITKADGTTVACSAYNTGAFSNALKQQFLAHTEFELNIPTTGESLQHG